MVLIFFLNSQVVELSKRLHNHPVLDDCCECIPVILWGGFISGGQVVDGSWLALGKCVNYGFLGDYLRVVQVQVFLPIS